MSGDVEFLDPEPPPEQQPGPAESQPATGAGRRGPLLPVAAAAWLAAAVLALVAPFQAVFSVWRTTRHADYLPAHLAAVDGWGGGATGAPRFGIGLAVCAAALVLLAAAALDRARRAAHRAGPARRSLTAAAVGVPCLLAGLVAGLALFVAAHPSAPGAGWTAHATGLTLADVNPYNSALTVQVNASPATPWCLWLAVAAAVCALAGSAGYLAWQAPARRLAG